jgi:NAD(P)-dependent dehydrogenase (short-subunit alcohol dehydrogenase family)
MTLHRPEVVVITGASSGVGRATARAFASRGSCIGLLARGRDGLEGARRDVEERGGKALVLPTDVAQADQVEAAAVAVEAALGPIDIWINNAMTSVFSPLKEMTAEEFRRVTEVIYLGYVYGTLAALQRMVPRDRGTIIQVGSALAYRGIPLQSAYCGAKHAVQGFTESLRCELLHEGSHIRLTMVQLPALNTPHFRWARNRLLPISPNRYRPSTSPRLRPERSYGPRSITGASYSWVDRPCSQLRTTRLRRGSEIAISAARAIARNKPRSPLTRVSRITCGNPFQAIMACTAHSITGPMIRVYSYGRPRIAVGLPWWG